MSEIRPRLTEAIDEVRAGKLPLDTAEQVHKLAHRHVMDRYADDKEARRLGDKAAREELARAQKLLKDMK